MFIDSYTRGFHLMLLLYFHDWKSFSYFLLCTFHPYLENSAVHASMTPIHIKHIQFSPYICQSFICYDLLSVIVGVTP